MSDREITVWWCEVCRYGRLERSTGVHQTANPNDPRGRLIVHNLLPVTFVPKDNMPSASPAQPGEEK